MSEFTFWVKLLLNLNGQLSKKSIVILFRQTNLWAAVHKQDCGVFFAWFQVVWFVQHSIQAETGIGREAKYLRRDIISWTTCTTQTKANRLLGHLLFFPTAVHHHPDLTCSLHHARPELRFLVYGVTVRTRQFVDMNTRRGAHVTVVANEHVKVLY